MKHLNDAGSAVGIQFNPNRSMYPTVDSHRLMEWCNQSHPEKADLLMENLFSSYFERAENISDINILCTIASSIGLLEADARVMLQSESFKKEVKKGDSEAKSSRISGVPFFIMSSEGSARKPMSLSGAQPVEAMLEVLQELKDAP